MLKQMKNDSEKEKTGSSSPEAVKPGTTVLPTLPPVNPLTSSVDIMDWMEMITTPMQDLSDGSAEWWTRVRKAATDFLHRVGELVSQWRSWWFNRRGKKIWRREDGGELTPVAPRWCCLRCMKRCGRKWFSGDLRDLHVP